MSFLQRCLAIASLASLMALRSEVLADLVHQQRATVDGDHSSSGQGDNGSFVPDGGAIIAGDYASAVCKWLGDTYKQNSKLPIVTSFSKYYPEGSNPSLELLSASYPPGLVPTTLNIPGVLVGVGPDVDIKTDHGYGRSSGRQAMNGPLGGLPAFCRFGASITTSRYTEALVEVWLPLASDEKRPLAAINSADYPTNSTPFEFSRDGKTIVKQPLWAPEARKQEEEQGAAAAEKEKGSKPPADGVAPTSDAAVAEKADGTADSVTPARDTTSDTTGGSQALATPPGLTSQRRRRHHQIRNNKQCLKGDDVLGRDPGWNGRLLFIANGAQRGFIPLTDMKQSLSRFRFATVSTNLGHFSNSSDTTWVVGPQYEDIILDWASRATHVSRQAGEEAINLFYGIKAGVRVGKNDDDGDDTLEDHPAAEPAAEAATNNTLDSNSKTASARTNVNVAHSSHRLRAYMAGCSTGGKAGLSSAMYHPNDFDGILAGSPAIYFNRLNRGQIKTQSVWRKEIAKDGFFNITLLPNLVHNEVLKQCDKLDGLADGVISNPRKCKPDLSPLLCPSGRPSDNRTCITQPQIENIQRLYTPTLLNGTFVYDQYFAGIEALVGTLTGTAGKAIGWYELAIMKYPKVLNNTLWNGYKNISLEIVEQGERLNPGGSNTQQTDLTPFLNAGKKMIHYHGLADITVSPAASMRFYDEVTETVKGQLANGGVVSDSYKFFPVPGMGHCRDGDAAWHFGGLTQNDAGNRPYKFDTQHDILLALVAWVEQGIEPHEPIAAKYGSVTVDTPQNPNAGNTSVDNGIPSKFQSYDYGLEYTRKLCAYPKVPMYNSGPTTGEHAHESFFCA